MATTKTPAKKAAAKKAVAARSATARAPRDHQAKAPEKRAGYLSCELLGKTWYVHEDAMDDFELMDDLNAMDQRSDPTRMPAVLRRFVGDEGFAEAMEVLRDKTTGRVTFEDGVTFVYDLMKALNPNSSR